MVDNILLCYSPPPQSKKQKTSQSGFTLVELSIVLVIIGLLVGGVLVGSDLINAAQIRSQIRQFDELNAGVATFQLKYGSLPGDLTPGPAAAAGFEPRTGNNGRGNGDGVIMGWDGTLQMVLCKVEKPCCFGLI
jgi:prepilin-type N-terminal cleavage/methylation domain-containing protein